MRGIQRDPKREAFWRRLVRGQAGSGLTIRAWCGLHEVSEPAFYGWRRELARRDARSTSFLPVRVVAEPAPTRTERPTEVPAGGGVVEIALSGGRRIVLRGRVDRQALADVLAVLEGDAAWPGRDRTGPSEARRCGGSRMSRSVGRGALEASAC